MFDSSKNVLLNLGVKPWSSRISTNRFPKLWQTQPTRSILMGNKVLSRSIDIPSIGPCAYAECNFFPHKAPWNERVEWNIDQEFGSSKEKSSCNESNLRWARFIALASSTCIDSNYMILDVIVGKLTGAKSSSRRASGIFTKVRKPRGVARKYGFRKRFCSFDLSDIFGIPIRCKLKVAVHLKKVCFSRPQLTSIIAGNSGSQSIRVMQVQDTDVPALTVFLIFWISAEFFNTVDVWWSITHLYLIFALRVLANDL
mmetsp:Transcript_27665/g.67295  ORF Transcript_27665/g.67295 Transcript_27665/m.67295 type:complete len:256 (-) Transcript_27665:765-1532(-)